MTSLTADHPDQYDAVCAELIDRYENGVVVLLAGALGAGKTAFVKRFAAVLGARTGAVYEASSPSFGVMHEYAENLRHFDLYRVGSGEFFARGLAEYLEGGWAFVEWADEALEAYLRREGTEFVKVAFELDGERRKISYEF